MAENENPNELSISYDDLTGNGRPAGWTVEDHATHEDTGMVVVWAPPAIVGLGLLPGQQLNYRRDDDGNVLAYSKGPHDGDAANIVTPTGDEREITPGHQTATSPTPQPQSNTTGLTPEPQADSTDSLVTDQDQSNTSPGGIGMDDVDAAAQASEAVIEATNDADDVDLDAAENPEALTAGYPIEGDNGWYELSDGSKVRGKDNADEAQTALNAQAEG